MQEEWWKGRSQQRQQQMRESDQIMRKIGQLRDGVAQYASNAKNSEKWSQYLPADNGRSAFCSVNSKQDKQDHYRQSLERRLQKLFRQQKDLLKERHYGNSVASISMKQETKQSQGMRGRLGNSGSIDNMQRKIRQLEEKYKERDRVCFGKTKDVEPDQTKNINDHFSFVQKKIEKNVQTQQFSGNILGESSHKKKEQRNRVRSEFVEGSGGEWKERERKLQVQVDQLKGSIRQIKQNNEQIMRTMAKKQERKKNKQRTKEILLNILHKLEFINVEVGNAKKWANINQRTADTTGMEKHAADLIGEYQLLKVQYGHLQEERRKVQARQEQIEAKLKYLQRKE